MMERQGEEVFSSDEKVLFQLLASVIPIFYRDLVTSCINYNKWIILPRWQGGGVVVDGTGITNGLIGLCSLLPLFRVYTVI